jgi:hypothetical protein
MEKPISSSLHFNVFVLMLGLKVGAPNGTRTRNRQFISDHARQVRFMVKKIGALTIELWAQWKGIRCKSSFTKRKYQISRETTNRILKPTP